MASRFYVTTPIYYVNDVPHLGSAYTTIAADVLARYHRLRGDDTRFLTGTDEHGLKIERAAQERGVAPSAFADEVSRAFREAWPALGCAPDDFIRTTEARHVAGAQEVWKRITDRNPDDIYLGHYAGLYCVSCEAYYTEKELEAGNLCPIHKRPVELVKKEESYFFRLSAYADKLLAHYAAHPEFVQPVSRRNEVESFVRGGLEDLSVSRTTFTWGVPVPGDPRHIMYVWFDALANYWTALGGRDDAEALFTSCVHLMGKDIIRFHAVYWPAFLMAAGLPLPKQVFAHGFLTYGGQKMSKTLRNTVSPAELAREISPEIGVDVVRYALMRAISFGHDGDFSIQDVVQRYHAELGNAFGNLVNRVLPFGRAGGSAGGATPREPAEGALGDAGPLEEKVIAAYQDGAIAAARAYDECNPTRALDAIFGVLAATNEYFDKAAPWQAQKQKDAARLGRIVATVAGVLEGVSVMIAPVMPTAAAKARERMGAAPLEPKLGVDLWAATPDTTPRALSAGPAIFPRLEKDHEAALVAKFSPPKAEEPAKEAKKDAPAKAAPKATIAFDDFAKIELKVGVVVSAERVKKKDKLLDLRVDTGDAAPRRIIAGIALAYAPEALVGKRVVVLANLAPRDFGKGLVSEGMLLAGEDASGLKLLTIDGGASAPGTSVG